jgi:hypothetical protein
MLVPDTHYPLHALQQQPGGHCQVGEKAAKVMRLLRCLVMNRTEYLAPSESSDVTLAPQDDKAKTHAPHNRAQLLRGEYPNELLPTIR